MNNTCISTEEAILTYGQILFISLGLLPILFCVPCWTVGKFVYEPMKKNGRIDETGWKNFVEEKKREIPYEERIPLKDISGGVVKLQNLIMEETPHGNVAMRYNKKSESFEYWSDRAIKYAYLETVARKYVNMFGCTELYIDRKKHLQEKILKLTNQIEINKREKQNLEKSTRKEEIISDDVFVKLKKYNQNLDTANKERMKITRDDYVCDIANKYIKKGKFDDNKILNQSEQNLPLIEEEMTWDDFKSAKVS